MTKPLHDQYTYTGGAHGSTIRTSDTWDFSSGRYLTLADFYPHNPAYREGIFRILDQQVKAREKDSPSTYFDDYQALIRSTFKPESFFATPKGIVIYFQQYDIAPYSTGIPEFLIPFKNVPVMPIITGKTELFPGGSLPTGSTLIFSFNFHLQILPKSVII